MSYMKYLGCLLFFINLIACNYKTQNSFENKEVSCKFQENQLSFDPSYFSSFDSIYTSFMESKYPVDLLHFSVYGSKEKAKRIYKSDTETWSYQVNQNNKSKLEKGSLKSSAVSLGNAIEGLEYGSFLQNCKPSSTGNYRNVYLVRVNGEVVIKYLAEKGDYPDLDISEKGKIGNNLKLFNLLNLIPRTDS